MSLHEEACLDPGVPYLRTPPSSKPLQRALISRNALRRAAEVLPSQKRGAPASNGLKVQTSVASLTKFFNLYQNNISENVHNNNITLSL
jgi:hypothetical protein